MMFWIGCLLIFALARDPFANRPQNIVENDHLLVQSQESGSSNFNDSDLGKLVPQIQGAIERLYSVGKVCETSISGVIESVSSNFFLFLGIKMLTAGEVFQGENHTETESRCGGFLTDPSGVLQSPNYPSNYNPNMLCVWKITVPAGSVIELKFIEFKLEEGLPVCGYDSVTIQDGADVTSPLIDRTCGALLPPVYKSSGNSILVTFKTDVAGQKKGFQAAYRSTIGPDQGCGGLVTTSSGTIMSPDVDGDGLYDSNVDCIWRIFGDPEKVLSVTFDDVFELEEEPSGNGTCPYDFLEVIDGPTKTAPLLGIYCGQTTPPTFKTSSNKLWLHFHSNGAQNKRGFKLRFSSETALCGGRLAVTNSSNTLMSPTTSQTGLRCLWTFQLNEANDRVEIHFSNFSLPCSEGYLEFDYYQLNAEPLGFREPTPYRMCGTQGLSEIYAEPNTTMLLVTRTDSTFLSHPGKGFKIEYKIANCSRVYSRTSGMITGEPNHLSRAEDRLCNITVTASEGSTISLYFTDFYKRRIPIIKEEDNDILSPNDLQCKSFLNVFDGKSSSSPRLAQMCEENLVHPISSTSNQLYLQLRRSMFNRGTFSILYTTTDKGRLCGGSITELSGSFTSPFFPSPYNETATCNWLITIPGLHTMTLRLVHLNLSSRPGCESNYLEIFEGNTEEPRNRVARYCGQSDWAKHTSLGNQFLVKLVTNGNNTGSGFVINFSPNPLTINKATPVVSATPMPDVP